MIKKTVVLILIFCLLLSLICSSAAENADYSFLDDMNIDELKTLKAEIEKRIKAQTNAAVSSSDYGMWEIKNYVDEFENQINHQYIRNKKIISGTFSNSVADNQVLGVRFLIDESAVSLRLYEYGDKLVKNSYSKNREYKVTMQDGEGKKTTLTGTMYSSGDRIEFPRLESDRIIYALCHDCKVSFYIVDQERKTNTYLFTISDSSFFSNVYTTYFGKEVPPLESKQEIYPAIYDQEKAAMCATQIPEGFVSWQLEEQVVYKNNLYYLSGTVVASKNDDIFYIDIGNQIIYVDFTEAYNKKTQSSTSVPSVGDQISVYCTFDIVLWDYYYKTDMAMFLLGI